MHAIGDTTQYQPINAFNVELILFYWSSKDREIANGLRFFSLHKSPNPPMRYTHHRLKWHRPGTKHAEVRGVDKTIKTSIVSCQRNRARNVIGMAPGKKEHMNSHIQTVELSRVFFPKQFCKVQNV